MTTYNFNLSNYHLSENTCRIANLNFIEETTNRNGEYMLRGLWASDLCYQFAKKCKFTLVRWTDTVLMLIQMSKWQYLHIVKGI